MLGDTGDFLARFRSGNPEELSAKRLPIERRKEIINAAIKESGDKAGLLADLLYDARFNKAANYSLAGSADKAIHLITLSNHLRTSDRNFNFIFSGPAERETQWTNLYFILPYVLFHAVYIVEALLQTFAEIDSDYLAATQLRRDLGLSLIAIQLHPDKRATEMKYWNDLFSEVEFTCSKCNQPFRLHLRNLRSLCLKSQLRCSHCQEDEVITFVSEEIE